MDNATLSAIAIAITSLAGSILTYRKFKTDSELAKETLKIESSNKAVLATSEMVDDLRLDRQYLRDEIDKIKAEFQFIVNGQNEKLKENHRQILELQYEVQAARERISVLEGENEQLRTENESLTNRINKLNNGKKICK